MLSSHAVIQGPCRFVVTVAHRIPSISMYTYIEIYTRAYDLFFVSGLFDERVSKAIRVASLYYKS